MEEVSQAVTTEFSALVVNLHADLASVDNMHAAGVYTIDEAKAAVKSKVRTFLIGFTRIVARELITNAIKDLTREQG